LLPTVAVSTETAAARLFTPTRDMPRKTARVHIGAHEPTAGMRLADKPKIQSTVA